MKDKTIVWAIILLLTTLPLSACSIIPSSYEVHASNAESRLAVKMQQLPTPRGAVLVKQVVTSGGGQMPECDGREIQALFGTNEMSFKEILDFYISTLKSAGWRLHLESVTDRGRSFDVDDEFSLAVSDLYNVSLVGKDAIREAQSKFQTIYLLELATSLELPLPSQCKEG